jgi:hypothetical protein
VDIEAAFVRYFEESTDALVRDQGFRDLVAGAYTATAGWARGTPPDPLYTLFAETEAAMRDHHIRLRHPPPRTRHRARRPAAVPHRADTAAGTAADRRRPAPEPRP